MNAIRPRSVSTALLLAAVLAAGALPLDLRAQAADAAARLPDYEIRAGDALRVRVWPDTALGGEFPVENTGHVYLPILGEVAVEGRTLEEVRAQLRDAYGGATRTPIVSVRLRFPVTVLGAVDRPGLYVAEPPQGVFDAVAMAGGFRENAKEDEIRVIRGDTVHRVDGEQALRSGRGGTELPLRSGDRVVVPGGSGISARDVLSVLQSVAILVGLVQIF